MAVKGGSGRDDPRASALRANPDSSGGGDGWSGHLSSAGGVALTGALALAAFAISAWMNFSFARNLETDAQSGGLLVAASVSADLLKGLLPFLFIGLWRRSGALALTAAAFWLFCVVWSIFAAAGTALEVWGLPLAPRSAGDVTPWGVLLAGAVIEFTAALGLVLVAGAAARRRALQPVVSEQPGRGAPRSAAPARAPIALGPESLAKPAAAARAKRPAAPIAGPPATARSADGAADAPEQSWENLVRRAQAQADKLWAEREAARAAEQGGAGSGPGRMHHGSAMRARLARRLETERRRLNRKDSA